MIPKDSIPFNSSKSLKNLPHLGCRVFTLDVITVDSLDLTLDLMLVYANGNEFDVIDGASDTISNNSDMKIILRWIPDLFDNVDDALTKLKSYGKTIKIIHWEPDDSITFKDPTDLELKAVQTADLLLE